MPSPPTPDLSVIVGFKDWGLRRLELALKAHAQSPFSDRFEVVVSDYGSERPHEVENVTRSYGAVHMYVDTDGPWSRSRALNAGLTASRADFVITSDADLLFTPALHNAVYDRLTADPGSAQFVQCRDLAPEFNADTIESFDWQSFEAHSTFRPRWGMGGMVAFPRAALRDTGGYDDRMEIYGGEDLDFAQRLAWAGYRISWIDDPHARIYHIWHPSSRSTADLTVEGREAIERNRSIYLSDKTIVRNIRRPNATPVATVAIATYNRADLLKTSLQSVLCQTVEDIEVLVVDDGSTDDTPDVVAAIEDPRVRYIHQDHGGVARARNRAVDEATAEYIVVHDDDDLFLPWRLEAHFDALRVGSHGTYGGWVDFDSAGNLTAWPGKEFSLEAIIFTGTVLAHGTLMLRKAVLSRVSYDEELHAGSDYNLVLRLAAAGVELNHTGEYHILRRRHETSLTHTMAEHQQESARRTTNLVRRSLDKRDEEAARKMARELATVSCRGAGDLDELVRPYLPDALVRRMVLLDDPESPAFPAARAAIEGLGASCKASYVAGPDGALAKSAVLAEDVPWDGVYRLQALGLRYRIVGGDRRAPADALASAPEIRDRDPSRVDGPVVRQLLGQVLEDVGPKGKFISVVFSEVDVPAMDMVWSTDARLHQLLVANGQQYVVAAEAHSELVPAMAHLGDPAGKAEGAHGFVVDLSDPTVRAALGISAS